MSVDLLLYAVIGGLLIVGIGYAYRCDDYKRLADATKLRNVELQVSIEHWKARANELAHDRDEWKARASRFIDQIGIKSDTLAAPAMQEPKEPTPDPARRVLSAIGISELPSSKHASGERPTNGPVLGVNEHAAAAALSSVLEL